MAEEKFHFSELAVGDGKQSDLTVRGEFGSYLMAVGLAGLFAGEAAGVDRRTEAW